MSKQANDRLITVCSACLRASCWHGNFMCDDAVGAGTVRKTVRELAALNREHPSYYSVARIRDVRFAVSDPTPGSIWTPRVGSRAKPRHVHQVFADCVVSTRVGAHWTEAVDWTHGKWRAWVEKAGATMIGRERP